MPRLRPGLVDWRRAAAEFVVIVAGVLMALAVDDLRQSQSDRRLERHLLETMLVDADETVLDLEEAVRSAEARMSAAAHLLRAGGVSVPDGETRSPPVFEDTPLPTNRGTDIGNWLIIVGYTQVFDPRTAGYDELMASGSLPLIRDPELRSVIVRHYQELSDIQESNQLFREDGLALRDALESAGLAVGDWLSDTEVIQRIGASDIAQASLRRTYLRAQEQPIFYPRIVSMVSDFRTLIEGALAEF